MAGLGPVQRNDKPYPPSYHLSQEKQKHGLALVTEAEAIVRTSHSSPAADIFQIRVSSFKSDVDDFMLRVEQRHKELDTLAHVHSFCEKVCVLSLGHDSPNKVFQKSCLSLNSIFMSL